MISQDLFFFFFFFNDTATTEIYTLSLHDALPICLAEIYDADTGTPAARLINISARASVGTGSNILIAGFVISGNTPEKVVIRGIGPTLSLFGVTGSLATPQLVLYDSGNNALQ